MNKPKLIISLVLAISILMVQVGTALAAPSQQSSPPVTGIVCSITLDTDPNTGVTTVIVVVDRFCGDQTGTPVRIDQKSAEKLGLIGLDSDGNSVINKLALGHPVEIKMAMVVPSKAENQHPVASALATFFSDLGDEQSLYSTIMDAHRDGVGFGVIAQLLWLTKEIPDSSLEDFQTLLQAKQQGDYTGFAFVDENGKTITPKNWAELRKAILAGKKIGHLGRMLSNKDDGLNMNIPNKDQNKDDNKEKNKDKGNNGNGNGKIK